jgi:sugar/nucleoside kinase (ribokinase family)
MKILGLGNALVDILISLPDDNFLMEQSLPKGSMQMIDAEAAGRLLSLTSHLPRALASGGSASNTIHGLANLGVHTAYIGKTGADEHGSFFRRDMEEAGIIPRLLLGAQNTGTAITFITPDSERTFGTFLGAAVELTPADISMEDFKGFDLLHIEGYLAFNQDLTAHIVRYAKAAGLRVSLDMASYNVVEANHKFLSELVEECVDILFANEEEAKAFTGEADPRKALGIIAAQTSIAVVKVGGEGSWVASGKEVHKVDAAPATVRDTTGAGDLFASGFLYGLSENKPLDTCLRYGSIAASKVIEVLGAKIDPPCWEMVKNQLKPTATRCDYPD